MWRKKLMLLALVMLSFCLSYQAVCYSSASVRNFFNIHVSSSENALIAIPIEDIIINIQIEYDRSYTKSAPTQTLVKDESKSVHTNEKIENINILSHNLTIKNNMQYKLTNVQAILKDNPDLLRFYYDEPILPGQEVKLSLNINKDDENIDSIISTEDEPLILIISADWDSGSANIEKNIRFAAESKEITIEENPVPTEPARTVTPKRTTVLLQSLHLPQHRK